MNSSPYITELVQMFQENADSDKAVKMSAYMKNRFPFFGIQSPERKQIIRTYLNQNGYPSLEDIEDITKQLWQLPQRELHYAAQEIVSHKRYINQPNFPSLMEYLIIHRSWWDTVDYIASNIAGPWFLKNTAYIIPITDKWVNSNNMWLQRSAMLFQLKYKHATNEELLFKYADQLSKEKDFFIRKAIGWALREYAKTNPEAVKSFIQHHPLSPLSIKEALKSIAD